MLWMHGRGKGMRESRLKVTVMKAFTAAVPKDQGVMRRSGGGAVAQI
jgi:hypothetical protein